MLKVTFVLSLCLLFSVPVSVLLTLWKMDLLVSRLLMRVVEKQQQMLLVTDMMENLKVHPHGLKESSAQHLNLTV